MTSFLLHSSDKQTVVSGIRNVAKTGDIMQLCYDCVISAILLLQSGFRLHDQSEFQVHVGQRLVMFILLYAVIRMNRKGERHALR